MESTTACINVLDSGSVTLIGTYPSQHDTPSGRTIEYAIVQSARVSYGKGIKSIEEDTSLIEYLYRHRHTSPFESIVFQFKIVCPIFVSREIMRHRTGSYNEFSQRYAQVPEKVYHPSQVGPDGCPGGGIRMASTTNKQSSVAYDDGSVDPAIVEEIKAFEAHTQESFKKYQALLAKGVAKEVCRFGLPMGTYTEFYMKMDLHNLLHFLRLRLDETAQAEIRVVAKAMMDLITPHVPTVIKCFRKYDLDAIRIDSDQLNIIREYLTSLQVMMPPITAGSERSKRELKEVLTKLGFS